MSVFAISDLHLPLGVKKPMDVFGKNWENYVNKIELNWKNNVSDNDYVIIPGDISWGTYLNEAIIDIKYIESLPGFKIISKGNHDYWWPTLNKLNKMKEEEGMSKIIFLHNNSCAFEDFAVCACRGWTTPSDKDFTKEDEKIYKRELIRLELSIKDALKKNKDKLIMAMHYPPLGEFLEIAKKYGVSKIVYGHLHNEKMGTYNEISDITSLVSCDYLSFLPEKLIL
ncbi:MAG: metallophosphoesterase [Bacillota bacterium]|nr:metallophosphoesterase [Bacillota bacterium]